MTSRKIKSPGQLKKIIFRCKKGKKRIAFTNGCFDILHHGHISYLEAAKNKADILVVALNTDVSIKKIKGLSRPIMKLKDRQSIVAALACVDYVTSFNETTPLNLIKEIKPDLIIKGADWKVNDIVGGKFVSSYGGKAVNVKYLKGYSTTDIIEKIKNGL